MTNLNDKDPYFKVVPIKTEKKLEKTAKEAQRPEYFKKGFQPALDRAHADGKTRFTWKGREYTIQVSANGKDLIYKRLANKGKWDKTGRLPIRMEDRIWPEGHNYRDE